MSIASITSITPTDEQFTDDMTKWVPRHPGEGHYLNSKRMIHRYRPCATSGQATVVYLPWQATLALLNDAVIQSHSGNARSVEWCGNCAVREVK